MSAPAAKNSSYDWAECYADFVIRFHWPLLLFLLVLTTISAFQIKNLDLGNDPDTLLPQSNRYVATNLYVEHRFGMGNLMVFTLRIKQGDVYRGWFVNKVREIHRRLAGLPTARASNFIGVAAKKIKFMGADEDGLVFSRRIPAAGISDDPEQARQQRERLNKIMPGVMSISIPIRAKAPVSPLCDEASFPEEIFAIEDRGERLAQCAIQAEKLAVRSPADRGCCVRYCSPYLSLPDSLLHPDNPVVYYPVRPVWSGRLFHQCAELVRQLGISSACGVEHRHGAGYRL